MPDRNIAGAEELKFLARLSQATNRRTFLKWSGVTIAVTATGCTDNTLLQPDGKALLDHEPASGVTLDFSNDFGVLNYAYALEQLEAAFYTQVIANPYSGITEEEFEVLDDLRKHEVIHREFYDAALGDAGIGALEVDFSSVDFSSRQSVLQTAQTFEDLGVAAYNGAAQMLNNVQFLVVAGKIVSVEARHAAAIRDLLAPLTFAPFAFDPAFSPSTVLQAADPFVVTEINVQNLPAGLVTFEGRNA